MHSPVLTRRTFAASALLAPLPMTAFSQAWPARPIRLVVPFPAGGGTDIIAREVANKTTGLTKWNFVIENKPGSGGNLGIENIAKSPADGYNLVLGQTSNLAINPSLYSKLPYDPVKDLTPVALIGSSPLLVVVAANSPFRTLADVVAAAKAKPGSINYATSGNGTVAHLATELFQRESNVKLTHIPYKGASQGLNDVIGGNVEIYVSSVTTLLGYIKNGKVRPLAVTSAKRSDDLPQVPTIAESGYKDFEAVTWFGLLGPARLPAEITKQLNAELNKTLRADDLRTKLESQGLEITPGTPEQFAKLIRDDIVKWGKVVKESGAKID
ncbi:tripartite tricarboxylate transporter substrate binding protein [Ramlibacter sp. AW1]|uniref:Tripartite tricarboxylate transporter substrate binding protein n=1 Tax=Ramlibacter aurantiacus TaxID=2801330 RepID=A0A936ZL64_9BURK|nr:tripartite tricarboxylate transporter substrate binding protein [Ramlibacter aurantiacus]